MHRLLRRGAHPAPAGRRHHRHRGQPARQGHHRRRGKTDTIDAQAAARAVLSGRATATAKTGDGPVEMLRMFKLAKSSAIKSRTQAINQLKAVLVAADPTLREALSGLSTPILIRQCGQLPRGRAQRRHQRRDLDAAAAGLPDHGADRRD
jgi:transposase